ncbi:MAG TPA: response regulator transcription factor [Opitutaceae bacterium]|nr:response regulator transcription factor [Opitutaceae bacterium]
MIPSVLLVDDHRVVQQGLRWMLENQLGMSVAGEAADGAGALALAAQRAFDLILLDLHLPDLNGIEVARRILEQRRDARIIILSSDSDPLRIDDALLAGVMGYVLKVNAFEELQRAIKSALQGQRYLSPEANAALLASYQRLRDAPANAQLPALSPREREVVRLIAAGQRTKEIAAALGIGIKSAETYRRRLMQKLGLFSVAELTRYAIREGLIEE